MALTQMGLHPGGGICAVLVNGVAWTNLFVRVPRGDRTLDRARTNEFVRGAQGPRLDQTAGQPACDAICLDT